MIQIRKAKNDKYYFRVMSKNGRCLCHSEMYESKQMAKKGSRSLLSTLLKEKFKDWFNIK